MTEAELLLEQFQTDIEDQCDYLNTTPWGLLGRSDSKSEHKTQHKITESTN